MHTPLDLEPLLTALRGAGLRVGVQEVLRLREVFARLPRLPAEEEGARRRLRAVLSAVVVKTREDRETFDRVLEAWLSRADLEWRQLEARELPARSVPGRAGSAQAPGAALPIGARQRGRQRHRAWQLLGAVALGGMCLWIRPVFVPEIVSPPPPPPPAAAKMAEAPPDFGTPEAQGQETLPEQEPLPEQAALPEVQEAPAPTRRPHLWPLSVAAAALLSFVALGLGPGRRRWLPGPLPPVAKSGPARAFLPSPPPSGPELLAPAEQDVLVWGIGHFVSDQPTRRANLPATVRATARAAGVLQVVFERARFQREVWLWLDEAAEDPTLRRTATEIETALRAYGLPVELATFRGLPERLVATDGQTFAPQELDERRGSAMVAVLTDGRLLCRQYLVDRRKVQIDAVLRMLSSWLRLAVVDFSAGGELAAILRQYELERLEPPDLPHYLGGTVAPRPEAASPSGDDAVWAAACALAPAGVDEATAFELRRHLGLTVSPWSFRALCRQAPGPAGRLLWNPRERARLVNWLRDCELVPQGPGGAGSLLARTRDFWIRRYDAESTRREGEDTPAVRQLYLERALFALWHRGDPKTFGAWMVAQAIKRLYELVQGPLGAEVHHHLGQLAAADRAGPHHQRLPWRLAERSPAERVMLRAMKLGGDVPAERLRCPGRVAIGLALCAGVAGTALVVGLLLALGW